MRFLLITLCLLAPSLGLRGETYYGLHLGSYHDCGNWNNFNPGAYIMHNGWTGGAYYNSLRKTSVYAGYTFQSPEYHHFRLGATAGIVTGYPYKVLGVTPMLLPSIKYTVGNVGLRLTVLPYIRPYSDVTVFHLSVEFRH